MPAPLPFLFDLDGTLADTLADIAATTNHVRALHGLPCLSADAVQALVGDGARVLLQKALDAVLPGAGVRREQVVDAAFAAFVAHHAQQCTREVTLFPGVREHLAALRARGHALAVVTNKPERFARAIVRHLDLEGLLPVVVGGDTLPQKKPDPAPLRHALRLLGCARDAGSMVGDGVQDLRAGKALGLHTVACLFGFGDPARLFAERADTYWRAFGVPVEPDGLSGTA
ncbi:MAG TPA: HAD-IA family hydrolase [Planctomycetota bacterium]|nr:HAD-IA family hydrolase [Planctomycetota bacterium]